MSRSISDAKDQRAGPFPQVGGIFAAWQNAMTLKKVTETIVNFEAVKTTVDFVFEGVFQPMTPREISHKLEGERNWKWWTLWVKPGLSIKNGDIIEDFNGLKFKVEKTTDWTQGGFVKHDLTEDYKVRA